MAYRYSNIEFNEMVRVYARCSDNVSEACREFARLFPNSQRPSPSTMLGATQRLRDFGQFRPRRDSGGRTPRHSVATHNAILDFFEDHPAASTNDAVQHESQANSYMTEMVPERAKITFLNPRYIGSNATVSVRRSARRGHYVINLAGYNLQLWDNNVTLRIHLFEFLHNEYRPSFVEANYRLCDYINNDAMGRNIRAYGIPCPLPEKYWQIVNATITFPAFPYKFPFSKCKVGVTLMVARTQEVMGRGDLYVTITQKQE